jgi:uncharacterized protein
MKSKRQIRQHIEQSGAIPGGREFHLTYRLGEGHAVPAILLLPASSSPVPAALLLHGYSSRKEALAAPVGRALLERGVASLAVDLPLHGTRSDPLQAQSARSPLSLLRLWRQAIEDVRLGVHYLMARPEIDGGRIGVVGYSMGALLSVVLAADEPRLRAVVLAAGGDLPEGTPFAAVARLAADPLAAVRRLAGRPLLMVNGRHDRTVVPAQAERLFAAAAEPKELVWWDAGHYLPQAAIAGAADWLSRKLAGASSATG